MPLPNHNYFKEKRNRSAQWNDPTSFRQMTGLQMMYLSLGLESMEDPRLRQIGRSLRTLYTSSVDGGMTSDEALDRALANLNELPKLLRENGGANLRALHQVMEKHPEYGKELPENLRDKSFLGHMRDVTNFLELDCEKSIKKYEDQLAAEEEERRRKEEEQKLKDEQNQKALKERRDYRQSHGAFAMPKGCDAYDAAGLFVQSAQQGGSEYHALQTFCTELGNRLKQREDYADDETAKRNAEFEKQYPDNASPELQRQLIDETMDSVSNAEKEVHLERWYPDGLEKAIEQKRLELDPSGMNPVTNDKLLREIYEDAMAEQYKDVLRQKKYGRTGVRDKMLEAGKLLAQQKIQALARGTSEEQESIRKQREQCRNDVIARRLKARMIEAYRAKQKDILEHYCHDADAKNRYTRQAKLNNPTDKQLYEVVMTDLLNKRLDKQENWNWMKQSFVGKFGAPTDRAGHEQSLDDMLNQIMDGEDLDEQVELELQRRVARELPQEEIDRQTDQLLGFQPPEKEVLLYEWARDTQKLRTYNEVLTQREREFTDITRDNLSDMFRLHNNLQTVLNTCKPGKKELADQIKQVAGPLREARRILRRAPLKEGKLGTAYNALDQAWTEADFAQGKALRKQSGIEPGTQVEDRDYGGKVPKPVRIVESSSSINIPLEWREPFRSQASQEYFFADESRKKWEIRQERKQKKTEKPEKPVESEKPVEPEKSVEPENPVEPEKSVEPENPKGDQTQQNEHDVGQQTIVDNGDVSGKNVLDEVDPDQLSEDDQAEQGDDERYTKVDNGDVSGKNVLDEVDPDQLSKDDQAGQGDDERYTEVENNVYEKLPGEEEFLQALGDIRKVLEKKDEYSPTNLLLQEAAKQYMKKENVSTDKMTEDDLAKYYAQYAEWHLNIKAGGLQTSYIKLKDPWNKEWEALQSDQISSPEERDTHLARFLTADTQMRQIRYEAKEFPTDDESFQAASKKLKESAAFKMLKDDLSKLTIKSPEDMANAFQRKQRAVQEWELKRSQLAKRMKPVLAALKETRRGTVLFFPRAGLLGNSPAYIDALDAVTRATEGTSDPATLDADTQKVMHYLNGKEKVRARAFGRERWTQCMTYLKNVLPRKEFKAYCDEVNQKRGVTGNPHHKNFVTPQSFGPTRFREAEAELLEDVRDAKRPEDCAALLALRGMNPNQKVDRRLLSERTQTIMANGTFQWLMKNPEKLTDYVKNWKCGDDFIEKYQDRAKETGKSGKDAKETGKPEKKLGNQGGPSFR